MSNDTPEIELKSLYLEHRRILKGKTRSSLQEHDKSRNKEIESKMSKLVEENEDLNRDLWALLIMWDAEIK